MEKFDSDVMTGVNDLISDFCFLRIWIPLRDRTKLKAELINGLCKIHNHKFMKFKLIMQRRDPIMYL